MAPARPQAIDDSAASPRAGLSALAARVLASLPMNADGGRWPTAAMVAARADITPEIARAMLVSLRGRWLAEDDGERPRAFARTRRGDWALEQAI